MGGAIAVPMSDEQFHEIMDVAESIVDKEIHEKCLLGSGALVIWNGRKTWASSWSSTNNQY